MSDIHLKLTVLANPQLAKPFWTHFNSITSVQPRFDECISSCWACFAYQELSVVSTCYMGMTTQNLGHVCYNMYTLCCKDTLSWIEASLVWTDIYAHALLSCTETRLLPGFPAHGTLHSHSPTNERAHAFSSWLAAIGMHATVLHPVALVSANVRQLRQTADSL